MIRIRAPTKPAYVPGGPGSPAPGPQEVDGSARWLSPAPCGLGRLIAR